MEYQKTLVTRETLRDQLQTASDKKPERIQTPTNLNKDNADYHSKHITIENRVVGGHLKNSFSKRSSAKPKP